MRMNKGTIILLLVSFIAIIAVLVLTINQAAAPGDSATATDTAEATPAVLFAGVTEPNIVRLEVRDNLTDDRLVLTKPQTDAETGAAWQLISPVQTEGEVDQTQVTSLVTSLLGLQTSETFEADELAQFGLDAPTFSIYAVADTGTIYAMHIGNQNPAGTRYYTVVEQLAAGTERADLVMTDARPVSADATEAATTEPETSLETEEAAVSMDATEAATAEATDAPTREPLVRLEGPQTLYMVNTSLLNSLILSISTPPVTIPTPEPTLPVIVTEEATAEATDMPEAEATDTADAPGEATPEATAES